MKTIQNLSDFAYTEPTIQVNWRISRLPYKKAQIKEACSCSKEEVEEYSIMQIFFK
jgi:hypothetical protein